MWNGRWRRGEWAIGVLGVGFLTVGFLLQAAGCGPAESPIAMTVGETVVRQDEFERAFWRAVDADSTLGPDLASVEAFAESHARDRLLDALILEHAGELQSYRQERLDAFHEKQMIDKLHQAEFGWAYEVTDAMLREGYEKLGRRLKLHRMVVDTAAEANEIRRVVREGGAFDKIALQRSLDDATRDAGGMIGWLTYTDIEPMSRNEVFGLQVGEVSQPLPFGSQFQLYYVADQTENMSRGTLEQESERLRQGILQYNVITAKKAYEKRLYETYKLQMDPVQMAWMTVYMREKTRDVKRGAEATAGMDLQDGAVLPRSEVPWGEELPVAPADTARVLATYADRQVKPLLVFDQLFTHPMPTWPRFETSADVEELIRELVLEQLEVLESRSRGFESDPEIVEAFREREAEVRNRQFMRTEVRSRIQPTDEEIQEYYELNLEQWTQPERRRFVAANVPDYDKAYEISEAMRAGASIDEITQRFGVGDLQYRSTGPAGTPPLAFGESPMLDGVLFSMSLDEVSEPIAITVDGVQTYTVVRLVEVLPESVVPLEEADTKIRTTIVDSRIPAYLDGLLDDAKHRYPVTIHWDVVRSSRLRPPA